MRMIVGLLVLLLSATPAEGQRTRSDPRPGDRAALEQRFRERFTQVVRERLGLTAAQMAQLHEVNGRFDARRRALFMQERSLRHEMREALERGDAPATQDRVAELMEQSIRVQRQRLDLLEEEQRALTPFMTPVQRAKYFGLQEQIRRRAEDMRRGAEQDSGARPRRPGMRRPGGGDGR